MKMVKETNISSIRVPKSVKDKLDSVALEKEPYHATIQRLIRENEFLTKIVRLHEEKENRLHLPLFERNYEWDYNYNPTIVDGEERKDVME